MPGHLQHNQSQITDKLKALSCETQRMREDRAAERALLKERDVQLMKMGGREFSNALICSGEMIS